MKNPTFGDSQRQDVIFLAVLCALSAVLYIPRLGFYSDDWSFFYAIQSKSVPSLTATLGRILGEDLPPRPGQAVLLVGMYRMFGADPLPFHILNALVLLSAVVLFYLALRRIGIERVSAFSTS